MRKNNDVELYGLDLFGEPLQPATRGPIADDFVVPPFTILNAREGFWQERKRLWISYGIEGEVGRDIEGNNSIGSLQKRKHGISQFQQKMVDTVYCSGGGKSVFDPVLCELIYRWFCPPGGQVVDPFAGGSVRGIVAHMLGRRYWGCDLSQRQIDANEAQAEAITPDHKPVWICGDSMDELDNAPDADLIFSCPPYADLEVYSDDPRDLSTMEYHTFIAAMKRIILRACKRLKDNRFACFVVGDIRDKHGNYRNFPGDVTRAFLDQGLDLYNEAILVTCLGSIQMQIRRQFEASRKMGKTHQNILVFVKGDGKKAAQALKES